MHASPGAGGVSAADKREEALEAQLAEMAEAHEQQPGCAKNTEHTLRTLTKTNETV